MYSHFLLGNILKHRALNTRRFPWVVILNQVLAVPDSGGEADRSVGEGFAGAQRGESEADHTLLQPGRGVPLLNFFIMLCSRFHIANKCLTILNVSSCQKLFSHLDLLEEEPLDSLLV